MVAHAYRAVPFFYRSWMDRNGLVPGDFRSASDLARLPLIDKSVYRRSPGQFAATGRQGHRGLELRTSGTTGQPAGVWHDRRALLLSASLGTREQAVIREILGADGCRREVVFRQPNSAYFKVQDYYGRELIQPPGRNRQLASTDRPPEESIELLNRVRPGVVSALGSYLGGLYRYAHRNRTHPVRGIVRFPDAPDRRLPLPRARRARDRRAAGEQVPGLCALSGRRTGV